MPIAATIDFRTIPHGEGRLCVLFFRGAIALNIGRKGIDSRLDQAFWFVAAGPA